MDNKQSPTTNGTGFKLKPTAEAAKDTLNPKKETPERGWDDLEIAHQKLFQLMVSRPMVINTMINTVGEENLEGDAELLVAINGLRDDIQRFAEKLSEIYALHKGKTGPTKGEEIAEAVEISLQYSQFHLEYEALITQPIAIITEKIEEAIVRLRNDYLKMHPEDAIPDPVKEETPTNQTEVQK